MEDLGLYKFTRQKPTAMNAMAAMIVSQNSPVRVARSPQFS